MGEGAGGVLTFAEQRDGEIHPVSYEILGKGGELADKLGVELSTVLLTGGGSQPDELIYRGAEKVYLYESSIFGSPNEIAFKGNIVDLISEVNPEIFLIGATNFGRSLAPRIAASLETGLTADCTDLKIDEDGRFVQIRPAFSGNVLAHIMTSSRPRMSTVRYGEFEEPERDEGRGGEVIRRNVLEGGNEDPKIMEVSEGEEVRLEDAEIVISGGRGLRDPSDFDLLEKLADLLGGEVGSSRPLVDDGWIDRSHQVGYSGKRVKPRIYIACGISGAPQHLAGMKESDFIIAINSDPSAPIFDVADYGIVGDLYGVIPEFLKGLREGVDCLEE
ncbi:hypothetical protein AKJ57_02390 [candidate division MSBL1 archaeon SCGC-AAA259A05]|uniref:Electron transfer flavoprotein alpha/beta-subunit N-terminal domain-containing protein n=1 Tax=candidate division MSBL1 archaeon SCGC-AAA259A05 TaxID=1698259 RepID=A0A133UAC9_9EURY|nr:hypothetical protein AKJ57_02390 [candidate division MSBL1 archaeon SCGC-AAA259A05]